MREEFDIESELVEIAEAMVELYSEEEVMVTEKLHGTNVSLVAEKGDEKCI